LPHWEFAGRARRYAYLDERLADRTRFFAAAAVTNAVLAELCAHRMRHLWLSDAAVDSLAILGRLLELVNLKRADCIEHEWRPSRWLDYSFIEMEQSVVELTLRRWALPQHRRLVTELDGLLRAVAQAHLPVGGSWNVQLYARVLRSLPLKLGRYPSFAVRGDRVEIGHELVRNVRRMSLEPGALACAAAKPTTT
jgi:hypothetical protein